MSLSIMLSRKGFTTDRANKRSFIGMGPQVRPQIVGPCESLRTQVALESGRMLLHPFRVGGGRTWPLRIGQVQDVVAIINRRRRLPPAGSRW